MNSVKDFRGKIEPPVEKEVLKIERYAQRLTQGYSAYGGSYLWAPGDNVFAIVKSHCFLNCLCFNMVSFRGQKSLGYAKIGL